ncbi:glycogen/starch/alpha-glucan phosphorylase, partial [Streptomyces sp. SID12501]
GDDHFFLFGLLEPQVEQVVAAGYEPSRYYEENRTLRRAIDLIASGAFANGDRKVFEPIVSNLLHEDRFLVLADFQSYVEAQERVDAAYLDTEGWTRSAILNVARSGFFSSDRSMWDYIDRIWHAQPVVAR